MTNKFINFFRIKKVECKNCQNILSEQEYVHGKPLCSAFVISYNYELPDEQRFRTCHESNPNGRCLRYKEKWK